ncbi:alpha/beta fold hydrolase [Streptomyces sp. NPDC055722]
MPEIQTADLHVHYEDDYFGTPWETKPVFLLQAGYAANSRHFATWVPGLASDFRVVRRDSVGHGRTSAGRPDRDLSLPALAEDIVRFMDALEIDAVHYVGERTGAMTGAVLAATHPDRVRSLTLFGCPIRCGDALQQAMWRMLAPELQKQYRGWNDAIAGLGGAFAWHEQVRWLKTEGAVRHNAWQLEQLRLCDEDLLERYAAATVDYDIDEYLPKIGVPTLIAAPTSTYRTNLDQQVRMRELIPDSELEVVEGSWGRADDGSGPHVVRRIRRFLERRSLL